MNTMMTIVQLLAAANILLAYAMVHLGGYPRDDWRVIGNNAWGAFVLASTAFTQELWGFYVLNMTWFSISIYMAGKKLHGNPD